MVDIEGALRFIHAQGQPIHTALADFAVGLILADAVTPLLEPFQAENGGWVGIVPGAPVDEASLTSSERALQWLRWLSADSHLMVDRTADYLAAHQRRDGSWAEAVQSGLPGHRLLHTATIARLLMENGRDTTVYFGRALELLSEAWFAGEVDDAPITTTAMMLPLFKIGGQPSDEPLVEGCNTVLMEAVAQKDIEPTDVTTIAHAALQTRYAGNRLYIKARNHTLTFQAQDGGWRTNRGDAHRVHATIDALMLLRWGGML